MYYLLSTSSILTHNWVLHSFFTFQRFRSSSYLSIDEMVGASDTLAVCRAHRALPVGFILLWYPVLFTAASLSLLHLIVLS